MFENLNPQETLGQNIRRIRENKGMSLRKLALEIGVSATFVSKLERDASDATASEDSLKKIAIALGINEDELLALSHKVADDVKEAIFRQPQIVADFLRQTKTLSPESMQQLQKMAEKLARDEK